MAETTTIVHPDCPNASNPYHQCGQYCTQKISERKGNKNSGPVLLNAPKSFDRRIKEPRTQPKPRDVPHTVNAPMEGLVAKPDQNGKLHNSSEIVPSLDPEAIEPNNVLHKPEQNGKLHSSPEIVPSHDPEAVEHNNVLNKPVQNGKLHSSSEIVSSHDPEAVEDKTILHNPEQNGRVHSSEIVPSPGDKVLHKPEQNGRLHSSVETVPSLDPEAVEHKTVLHKPEQNARVNSSSEIVPSLDPEALAGSKVLHKPKQNGKLHSPSHDPEAVEYKKVLTIRSLSFDFPGITKGSNDSDSEDMISMISDHDSRTWVGKYNVKSSITPTLQSIISKHGDIAAKCQLESPALRAYYLECICFIVQELQSTPTIELTNVKIKEMLAIIRDVESAQIDIGWLRQVLDEIIEIIEPIALQRCVEAVKASVKRELEARKEELAAKEKEVGDVKVRIAETEARLSQIEVELSELNEKFWMKRSKVEGFDFKGLLDELV